MVHLPSPTSPTWGGPDQSYCNECRGRRAHTVLHEHRTEWHDDLTDQASIWGCDNYYLVECAGCKRVHLRHDSQNSEDTDENHIIVRTQYYPPAYARRRPDWLTDFRGPFAYTNHPVGDLLEEIYVALQNSLPRIAAMGIRAVLEHTMVEKAGDHGNFGANVDAFFELGFVAANDKAMFKELLLEIGNAAIHRSFKPSADDLEVIMDVVEPVIHAVYVRPFNVERLSPIPPRQRRIK